MEERGLSRPSQLFNSSVELGQSPSSSSVVSVPVVSTFPACVLSSQLTDCGSSRVVTVYLCWLCGLCSARVLSSFSLYLWSFLWALRGLFSSAGGRSRCSSRSPRASGRFSAELPPGLATLSSSREGTGGNPPSPRSFQRGGCKVSCARPRSYSGGFSGLSMLILRSRQLQGSGFLASRLLPHARFTAAVHTVQDRLVERMTHSAVASGSRSCSEWRGFIFYE